MTTGLAPYSPGARVAGADLRLDGNEGAAPSDALWEVWRRVGPEVLRRYPDASSLEAAIAARLGVEAERVLVTAGADEALDRACRAFLAPGAPCVLPEPTFVMLERYAELARAELRRAAWPSGAYPTDAVLDAAGDDAALVAVVSPNNPTGALASAEDIQRISAARPDAVLLVDLAYTEFADVDLTPVALSLPNAVVTRTLSKAYGLAGLRVGYAVGPAPLIRRMRASAGPYPVSTPSLLLAAACLDEPADAMDAFVDRVRVERDELVAHLAALGLSALPSQGNFVFVPLSDRCRARRLHALLGALGVAVRLFAETGDLRITCPGDEASFARLLDALSTAAAPDALLFDMDGVLVDVGSSYRAAIVAAAARFGVPVTGDDVTALKLAGDANCDWDVTARLVRAGGVEVPFDDVQVAFEEVYQGTDDTPGLRELEAPLVDRAWLERLAAARPLAVVTGRPRRDAEFLLERYGWRDLFAAVVCREDAAPKPAPDAVRLALEQLGARTAWMLGDTPDDIDAARAAGVAPFGVAPPSDPDTTAAITEGLSARGVADVLTDTAAWEDWLR